MASSTNGVAAVAIVVLIVIAVVFLYMMTGQEEDIELDVPDIDIDGSIEEPGRPPVDRPRTPMIDRREALPRSA